MNYKKRVINLIEGLRLISADNENIYVQARYGPSKIVKLPLKIDENLSCFAGMVIGDGHLTKNKSKTAIESSNIKLLKCLQEMNFALFNNNASIRKVIERKNKKQSYHLTIYSKAIQDLMNKVFEIPRGKKSGIVNVPTEIMLDRKNIKTAFIIGLLAAEGSRKGNNQVRMCSASKILLKNVKNMLEDIGIENKIESWTNQKYKKEYYSLSFKRYHLDILARECRSGQTGLILSIFKKVTGGHA